MKETVRDYAIRNVPFSQSAIDDSFWSPRVETAISTTIPYDFQKCEDTGRIDNFAKAGGLMPGAHEGIFYNDSDVFKVVEGAAYALTVKPDAALEAYVDELIEKMAAAQEADGYLYTARTIDGEQVNEQCGATRWSNLRVNHELYNVGHMYEAAVAYFEATGKRTLLDVALKNADLIDRVFGTDKRRDVPGHQEIELALIRLYRVTGDEKHLRLARFFLDERGQANGRALYGHYCQDHLPVTEQREAVGHAVRAGYQYAGMTDIAAITGDDAYRAASLALWENVVGRKLALTGGIGARRDGEAFGADYELPSLTAYNETCAAQSSILWNHRLFMLTGEAKFIDVLERTLYNGFLSGVGMDGTSFFYENPLACDGEHLFSQGVSMSRRAWFETSCCPTNVVRLLPSLSGYIYAVGEGEVYVNLYIAGEARLNINGVDIRISQETKYPWDGAVRIVVAVDKPARFTLKLRLPGFVRGEALPSDLYAYLDGDADAAQVELDGAMMPNVVENGYVTIEREWQGEARIDLHLPMATRRVIANPKVKDLQGQVALERGPIVYALEAADHEASVLSLGLHDSARIAARHEPDLLGGVTTLHGEAVGADGKGVAFKAIPYHAWGHRGEGEMTVWLRRIKR